jgi:D-alanine-D-alanine ligase-like ATP-grasp enzyme
MCSFYLRRKSIDGVKKLKKIENSTILVLEEAEKNQIEWSKISYTDLFKLTYKNETRYFHGQIPSTTTEFAAYCCNNKRICKNILSKAGISVSRGYQIEHNDKKSYRLSLFDDLKKPLVLKPVSDQQGNNVHLNIKTQQEYISATKEIYDFYGKKTIEILVEEMFVGDEYRILATQEKILSVIRRLPANVVGDGRSSIARLIAIKNKDPLREKVSTYKKIDVDEQIIEHLEKQQLDLASIPAKDLRVMLRPHSPLDISLGGDTIDITEQIHPSVKTIVDKIMSSIPGLALTGIDYMSKDIFSQQTNANYQIIEINASPSLDWNEFPIEGPHRRIAYEFLKIMFQDLP